MTQENSKFNRDKQGSLIQKDASNLEVEFKTWMRQTISQKKQNFSDTAVGNYSKALKEATAELQLEEVITPTNLFCYDNLHIFKKLLIQIKSAKNYNKINIKYGNQAFHAGLKLYEKFLQERLANRSSEDIEQKEKTIVQKYVTTISTSPAEIQSNTYTKADFLKEVFMDSNKYETLKTLLFKKKNIILQGAPGVGKTFTAKRFAYSLLEEKDEDKIKMIQFHQNYSYEDFIMGYRPNEKHFELKYGPFYTFCKKAAKDLENEYFFIIDEINRGQMSKIFGELLMLIEADKRGEALPLVYTDEEFNVPKNLYILGMMNTADRSLAMIDYALRRRFSFVDFHPAFETESFKKYTSEKNSKQYNDLISKIIKLNKEILQDPSLGEGFQIGHSYFCTNERITETWLSSVVDYEIIPLLKEYWFDEVDKIQHWTNELRDI